MTDSPEMPGPGYDAQTRPAGQPDTANRTDPYGSAEHITVALTPPDYAERAEYKPTSTKSTSTTEGGRPMTDRIRERHVSPDGDICWGCSFAWPCDAVRAADERDAARADADRLAEALVAQHIWGHTERCQYVNNECTARAALRAHDEVTR